MATTPETWTPSGLAADFVATHTMMENRSFAFVLGAGASVPSGIPSGGELVDRWLNELHKLLCYDERPVDEWATADNLEISGFEFARAAEFYPQVFLRRFRGDRDQGYAYLEYVMERAEPSYGYSVLAQILSDTRHRVVITTNFDNLVPDALSIYGSSYPLIAGHESLTGFIRGRLRRPLIAKIHRDLFLEPKNDPEGVATLPDVWRQALAGLLREHTPIFIGYGGNDGSLMGFLETLSPEDLVGRPRWCYRESDGLPRQRVIDLVSRLNGVLVPVQGFDEQLLLIGNALEFGLRDQHVRNRGVERGEVLRKQFEQLARKVLGTAAEPATGERGESARRAINETLTRNPSPGSFIVLAIRAEEPKAKLAILRRGLEVYPRDPDLMGFAAVVLAQQASASDAVDDTLQEARELAEAALASGLTPPESKALLYHEVLGQLEEADRWYQESSPTIDDPQFLGNWAEVSLLRGQPEKALNLLAQAREAWAQAGPADRDPREQLVTAMLAALALILLGRPPTEPLAEVRRFLEA